MNRRCIIMIALALAVSACASGGSPGPRSNRSLLTPEEIRASGYNDTYSTIESLRPQWLIKRSGSITQTEPIRVYIDQVRAGGIDDLRQLPRSQVDSVRYYNGIEASERWGLNHGNGAIQVYTRRG